MMGASIGVGASALIEYSAPNSYDQSKLEHHSQRAAAIFLATILVSLPAAKLLKGRVTLPIRANVIFGAAVATTSATASFFADNKAWRRPPLHHTPVTQTPEPNPTASARQATSSLIPQIENPRPVAQQALSNLIEEIRLGNLTFEERAGLENIIANFNY